MTEKGQDGFPDAVVAAIVFDRTLNLITEKVINIASIQAVTALKRMPSKDDLILGCFGSMLVVRFTGNSLDILLEIPKVHSNVFADIEIYGRDVYSVCKNDNYVAITNFDTLL